MDLSILRQTGAYKKGRVINLLPTMTDLKEFYAVNKEYRYVVATNGVPAYISNLEDAKEIAKAYIELTDIGVQIIDLEAWANVDCDTALEIKI